MVVEVIINSNAKDLNRIFDYNVPEKLTGRVKLGSKVIVPFGTMKKSQEGFVIGIKETSEYKIKDIINVENGLFDEERVLLSKLMANKYFCNISDCIRLMLPPGTTSKNMQNRVKDKEMKFVYLKKEDDEIQDEIEAGKIKSEKQVRTLKFLMENDEVLLSELVTFADTSTSVVKTLQKNGYLEIIQKEVNRNPFKNKNIPKSENLSLTKEQQKAMNKIEGTINDKEFKEFLLYGVTGSRKNRNILAVNRESIRKGKDSNSISSRNITNTTNGR